MSSLNNDWNETTFASGYAAGNACSDRFQHMESWANSKISSYYFNSLSDNSQEASLCCLCWKVLVLPKIIFTRSRVCGQRLYWANVADAKLSRMWELIGGLVPVFFLNKNRWLAGPKVKPGPSSAPRMFTSYFLAATTFIIISKTSIKSARVFNCGVASSESMLAVSSHCYLDAKDKGMEQKPPFF